MLQKWVRIHRKACEQPMPLSCAQLVKDVKDLLKCVAERHSDWSCRLQLWCRRFQRNKSAFLIDRLQDNVNEQADLLNNSLPRCPQRRQSKVQLKSLTFFCVAGVRCQSTTPIIQVVQAENCCAASRIACRWGCSAAKDVFRPGSIQDSETWSNCVSPERPAVMEAIHQRAYGQDAINGM